MTQAEPPLRRVQDKTIDDAVLQGIAEHGGLAPGEMVVHYDLVAAVLVIDEDGQERTERRWWPMRGSDPHLSEGYLRAAAERVLRCRLIGDC